MTVTLSTDLDIADVLWGLFNPQGRDVTFELGLCANFSHDLRGTCTVVRL